MLQGGLLKQRVSHLDISVEPITLCRKIEAVMSWWAYSYESEHSPQWKYNIYSHTEVLGDEGSVWMWVDMSILTPASNTDHVTIFHS